jgi:small subunit ribosomal protein S8e
MAISHARAKTKPTGGKYKFKVPKKNSRLGSVPTLTKLGKLKKKVVRKIGGNTKERILETDIVNLFDKKTKKYSKAKIQQVLENPANRHYVRRNILTKGTVIKTDKGNAKITNRPGQEGVVNAVLIK